MCVCVYIDICVLCVCVCICILFPKGISHVLLGSSIFIGPLLFQGRQDGVVAANVTPKVRLTGFEFDFSSYQM